MQKKKEISYTFLVYNLSIKVIITIILGVAFPLACTESLPEGLNANHYHNSTKWVDANPEHDAQFLFFPENCKACHGEDLNGDPGVSCLACHHNGGWKKCSQHGQSFVNNTKTCKACHGQELEGGVVNISCVSCHHKWGVLTDPLHGAAFTENPAICSKCHGDDLKCGYVNKSCLSCHHSGFSDSHGESFNLNSDTCESCHGDDLNGGLTDVSCITCHDENLHHEGEVNIYCDSCHHDQDISDCANCHGHSENYNGGTYYGSTQSHATHTETNSRGPETSLSCSNCHDIYNYPSLADINVCNNCHSPGGSYDGVNDPDFGAKTNWSDGVYNFDILEPGKEKWCASCHDKTPANSKADGSGINAPNIVGDEAELTNYGIGWGFYKTGHGLPADENYAASLAPGAGVNCTDCHDVTLTHIDNEHRTYAAPDNPSTDLGETYQQGYRLKSIAGDDNPMFIPNNNKFDLVESDFALCFSCHIDTDPYLDSFNMMTNFRDDIEGRNDHWFHLNASHGHFGKPYSWDSDWSLDDGEEGNDGDSLLSCPACHNVHGSPLPRMIRNGQLISSYGTEDKTPALGFMYQPSPSTTLPHSTGGKTSFHNPGPGTPSKNGVCNMCHNDSESYTRTPIL